jgi:ADP-ribose pyrophosphatase YjhB (NUDIX family)
VRFDPAARSRLPRALRVVAYRAAYRMPARWRRGLVRWLKPRYTVGALTLARTETGDRLLLLRQPPGARWTLPGGLLNRNERPIECAVREFAEETGIRLSPADLRPANPTAVVHINGRWVDVVFEATLPANTPTKVDGAEVYEAAFHAVDGLPPLTRATARLLAHYGIGPYVGRSETLER